jgi:hypothetical protein
VYNIIIYIIYIYIYYNILYIIYIIYKQKRDYPKYTSIEEQSRAYGPRAEQSRAEHWPKGLGSRAVMGLLKSTLELVRPLLLL